MSVHDPPRLLAPGSDAPPALRMAIEAARVELPAQERLVGLAERLGVPFGPGGGGGGSGGPPTAGPATSGPAAGGLGALGGAKLAATVVLGAAVVAGVVGLSLRHPAHDPAAPTARAARATDEPAVPAHGEPSGEPTAAEEEPEDGSRLEAVETAPGHGAGRPGARRAVASEGPGGFAERDPGDDLALLRRAQRALSASPARSLELVAEHEAAFPASVLAQEREVIAIEALSRLGRGQAARVRAERFSRRWPGSSHNQRLDRLTAPAPGPTEAAEHE